MHDTTQQCATHWYTSLYINTLLCTIMHDMAHQCATLHSIHNTSHQFITLHINAYHIKSIDETTHQCTTLHINSEPRPRPSYILNPFSPQLSTIILCILWLYLILHFLLRYKISTCIVHTLRLVLLIILRTLISDNFFF